MTAEIVDTQFSTTALQGLVGRAAAGPSMVLSDEDANDLVWATNDRRDRHPPGMAPPMLLVGPAVEALNALARWLGMSIGDVVLAANDVEFVGPASFDAPVQATATVLGTWSHFFRAAIEVGTEVTDQGGAVVARMTTLAVTDHRASDLPRWRPRPVARPDGSARIHTNTTVPNDAARRFASAVKDFNAVHVDDLAAQALGFPRSILHGMCLMGILAVAASKALHRAAPRPLEAVGAQFIRPVFPGDVVTCELSSDGPTVLIDASTAGRAVVRGCWARFALGEP